MNTLIAANKELELSHYTIEHTLEDSYPYMVLDNSEDYQTVFSHCRTLVEALALGLSLYAQDKAARHTRLLAQIAELELAITRIDSYKFR